METNLPNNFTNLLMALQYRKTYQKVMANAIDIYNLRASNIQDLTPAITLQLYRTIIKKFYMNRTIILEGSWFQNQLRVFLFVLIGYLYVHKKNLQQMQMDDWTYFSPIFNSRTPVSFEFQSRSILKMVRSPKWVQSEVQILQKVINQKKFRNKWNSIARQLFIRSNKQFYRTPKQCRQRWLNYLDPQKKRTGWDLIQDLTLLNTVVKNGKRWSKVVKELKGSRTQHSVKNRYKSLLMNESKKYNQMTENQILKRLIRSYRQALGLDQENQKRQSQLKMQDELDEDIQKPNLRTSYSYNQSNTQLKLLRLDQKRSFQFQNQQFQGQENQFLMSEQLSENIPINEQYKKHHGQMSPTFQFNKPVQQQQFQEDKDNFRFQQQQCQAQQHNEEKINYFGDEYDCFR